MRSVDDALRWLDGQVSSGAAQWRSRCLGLAAAAYGFGASGVAAYGSPSPTTWFNSGKIRNLQRGSTDAPRGALLIWTKPGAAGHIAISAGNGKAYTNLSNGRVGLVSIGSMMSWGNYRGWAPPAFPAGQYQVARGWDETVGSQPTVDPNGKGPEWLARFLAASGLSGNLLRTAWAIAMRESRGTNIDSNSSSFNGADYGLFQINQVHANRIREKFGWSLDEVGRDAQKNLKVFLWMSKQGKDLSAWNMGSNPYDPGNSGRHTAMFRDWYNRWDDYRQYAQDATIADPGGDTSQTTNEYDDLSPQELAEEYGFVYSVIKDDPELWNLFQEATAGDSTWTPEAFKAKLKATKWWDQHSSYYRQTMTQRAEMGRKAWRQKKADARAAVLDRATKMGADLASIPDETLSKFVHNYLYEGWDQRGWLLDKALSNWLGVDNEFAGEAGTYQDELRVWAADMGIDPGDQWYREAVKQLAAGTKTIDSYKDWITEQAKLRYPALSQQYDATGLSTKALMTPYLQDYANILEVPVNQVRLDDPLMTKALGGRGPDGAATLMSQWDFQQALRQDPRWKSTGNGRRSTANLMSNLLREWGFGEGTVA